MPAFVETLESRLFLSVTPVGIKAPPETIAADRAAIIDARAAIPRDKALWAAQLKVDRAWVPSVIASVKASIRAAQQAVRDARGNSVNVQTARGELLVVQANGKSAIATANSQIKVDTGQSKIVLADDKRALTQATVKLRIDQISK